MGVPRPQHEPKTVVVRSDVTRRNDPFRDNLVLNANGEPVTFADVDEKPSQPDLLLGRYSILETRASGGFGMVQVCWDTRLQRRVAIKLIPLADPDDPNILASTIQDAISEARTASMLGHPNIVTVLDFENDEDYAYLVMEYVNGLTLTELLQRVEGGVLTFEECAHVVRSVSAALAFSHENGVLHLDIKPSNILIDRMGTVKLGDFGMAALASAAGYGGARGGTVGYMPPEQIAGDMVDERCDLFSFAVVLWQALAGSNPFAASTAGESFDKIRKGPQVALSKIDPEISPEVEEIFDEALEPDPSDRMVSVEEFGYRLVDELGDPDAGQESLRRLLDQLSDDEETVYPSTHERIPLLVRMPWLEEALIRFFTAASSGYLTWLLSEALVGGVSTAATATMVRVGATVAGALLGALLPSVIGLLLGILLASTFVFGPFAGAYPVQGGACAVLVVFLTASWWISSGKGRMLSGLSMSAAASLSQPMAGVSLSGWGLEPVPALLTSVFSWFFFQLVGLSVRTGFHAGLVVEGLVSVFRTPSSWIWMAGLGISALACSFLCGRNRRWLAVIGQILGTTGACFTYACTRTLENNGIWGLPDQSVLVPALIFCVSVSVAIIVFGPPQSDQEVN